MVRILLIGLLTPVSLIFLLLLLPVTYVIGAELCDNLSFSFRGRLWRLGSLQAVYTDNTFKPSFSILGRRIAVNRQKGKSGEARKEKGKGKKKAKRHRADWRGIVSSERIKGTVCLCRDLVHMIRPKRLRVEGKIGFSEPHLTSYMLACLSQIKAAATVELDIQPVWVEEYCDVELEAEGRMVPLRLLWRVVIFACSKQNRNLWLAKFGLFRSRAQLSSGNSGNR
ncbi:MAG: hypothetical protein M0R49_05690 [Limnochordia bacterium]|nr:hypothetical protein [Limnochordia bacterium]